MPSVVRYVQGACQRRLPQSFHLRNVGLSLFDFECELYLVLLERVNILLIDDRTGRLGLELLLLYLLVVQLLEDGDFFCQVLLFGQYILQILVLE